MSIKKWSKIDKGCLLELDNGIMELFVFSSSVIRCKYQVEGMIKVESVLDIDTSSFGLDSWTIEEDESCVYVNTERLRVIIDKKEESILWKDRKSDNILLQEGVRELSIKAVEEYAVKAGEAPIIETRLTVDGEKSCIVNLESQYIRSTYGAKLYYHLDSNEKIYGLGQGEDGYYNYRGKVQYLYQHNMRIPMPFFLSSKNYGIFYNTGSCMVFRDEETTSMELDAVDQLEYFFIAGDRIEDIICEYRKLLGKAAMIPKWAFGYLQSKERYKTADELVSVVQKYRDSHIPLDGVIMDWHTWSTGLWGDKNLEESRFYNMEESCNKIHDMNARVTISIWPNMNAGGENHQELSEKGYLLNDYSTYDAFDEDARKIYWNQANSGLYSRGIDAWWCDCTEPFSSPDWTGEVLKSPKERYDIVAEEHKKFIDASKANMYSLVHAQGIYENQRAENPSNRIMNLTRSGYAGSHKYGVVLWSGDISATWKVLKRQITEGLNMAMSGIPYWTLDIGAFFTVKDKWENRGCGCDDNTNPLWFWKGEYNDGNQDLGYRELYTRWLQFGTFLPMFRSHGTDTAREIWNFGEPGTMFYDSIAKFIKLRYELMPYIYSLAGRVTQHNYTMLRSLIFDYSHDSRVGEMSNEFMFGDYCLVCPVTEPMYYEAESLLLEGTSKSWECYLPEGNGWYDYWTNQYHEGGQTVIANATIDVMPLYIKEGAILIKEEGLEYANESVATPLHIYVYEGANGEFLFYEDDGQSYRYEDGEFNEILFSWNNSNYELTIGDACNIIENSIVGREIMIHIGMREIKTFYEGKELTIKCKR